MFVRPGGVARLSSIHLQNGLPVPAGSVAYIADRLGVRCFFVLLHLPVLAEDVYEYGKAQRPSRQWGWRGRPAPVYGAARISVIYSGDGKLPMM